MRVLDLPPGGGCRRGSGPGTAARPPRTRAPSARRHLLGLCLALALALALAACGAPAVPAQDEDPAGTPSAAAPSTPSTPNTTGDPGAGGPVDFVVVGDSLTAGSQSIVDGTRPGPGSWVDAADVAPARFTGGWAVPGATTEDMVVGAAEVRAGDDDLVVLAGTNDVGRGVPAAQTLANIETIVGSVGAAEVLLVAIPPMDGAPDAAAELNQELAELAAARGWQFTDPWSDVRDGLRWSPEASADGVHPTQEVADAVGSRIRAVLVGEAG